MYLCDYVRRGNKGWREGGDVLPGRPLVCGNYALARIKLILIRADEDGRKEVRRDVWVLVEVKDVGSCAE